MNIFLLGKVRNSVLVKHYLTPRQDYKDVASTSLEKLKQDIEQ
jgi:hypothetical protein